MTQTWYNEQKIAPKHSVVLTKWNAERAEQKNAVATQDLYKELLGRHGVKSGAVVNHKTAFEVSTVYRCIALKAEGLAMVPFKLHQKTEGVIREADDLDLYWLLSEVPNDFQTSFEFREQIALHLELCAEAFVFKNIVNGRIVELLPYQPGVVTKVTNSDMSMTYKISLSKGGMIEVPAKNMWHIKGKTWDGTTPIEVLKVAREAIGLSLATEEHSARSFSNGAKLGGILSTDSILDKPQLDQLRESWQLTQGGSENAYKTAVLFGGLTYQAAAQTAVEAQLNETRDRQVQEICRFFGVLPIMVGYADKTATYASAEAMFTAHVMYTLMPLYRRVEQSANKNLVGLSELKKGFYTKFNASALLRGSVKDRAAFYKEMYNIASLCPNEIRAYEELNPYEGGDQYRAPLNMADPNDKADDADKDKTDKDDDK